MKKITLLLFLFIIVQKWLPAQEWRVGLKAGLSIPKLRASKDDGAFSSGYKTLMGPQAGFVAEYQLNKTLSIQTELNYSAQGGKKSGRQKILTTVFADQIPPGVTLPQYIYANFNSEIDLSYLELPLMARINFKTTAQSRLSFFGGPYIGYLIKATGKSDGKSRVYVDPQQLTELTLTVGGITYPVGIQDLTMKQDIIKQCNRTNFGFQGGMAYTYAVSKWEFFLAAGGTYGLKNLQKDSDLGQNKTGGASVTVGATVKL